MGIACSKVEAISSIGGVGSFKGVERIILEMWGIGGDVVGPSVDDWVFSVVKELPFVVRAGLAWRAMVPFDGDNRDCRVAERLLKERVPGGCVVDGLATGEDEKFTVCGVSSLKIGGKSAKLRTEIRKLAKLHGGAGKGRIESLPTSVGWASVPGCFQMPVGSILGSVGNGEAGRGRSIGGSDGVSWRDRETGCVASRSREKWLANAETAERAKSCWEGEADEAVRDSKIRSRLWGKRKKNACFVKSFLRIAFALANLKLDPIASMPRVGDDSAAWSGLCPFL
ncbi:MAG: hypothetical protein LBB18_01925 [Puniceicoccales bacterium]|nr:hypothetical protein [Puniceicoccales bacterium]